jgi:glutamate-1-semialdehyde aminotransferase
MFGLHFTKEEPINGEKAERTKDRMMCSELFAYLVQKGIAYLSPRVPHFTVSEAHRYEEVQYLADKIGEFLKMKKHI